MAVLFISGRYAIGVIPCDFDEAMNKKKRILQNSQRNNHCLIYPGGNSEKVSGVDRSGKVESKTGI